jgi:hypothetical protein
MATIPIIVRFNFFFRDVGSTCLCDMLMACELSPPILTADGLTVTTISLNTLVLIGHSSVLPQAHFRSEEKCFTKLIWSLETSITLRNAQSNKG